MCTAPAPRYKPILPGLFSDGGNAARCGSPNIRSGARSRNAGGHGAGAHNADACASDDDAARGRT